MARMGEIKITFECKKCGPTALELPDHYTDRSIVKCKSCGAELGRYRDIKAEAVDAATAHVRGAFKGIFSGKM